MGRTHVHKETTVRAPIEFVFERITDHEAMADWPGISECRLVVEGEPKNGLGAVREIKTNGVRLQEEVVVFDPPVRYEYTIIKGLPVKHRGVVTLAERGDEVVLEWDVTMSSRIPLFAQLVGRLLAPGLGKALAQFTRECEAAHRA